MWTWRVPTVMAGGLLLLCTPGCGMLDRGPSDEEVTATVRKSPPSPPTLGPTYLVDIQSVEIQERGRYNRDGRYWPFRVRVRGNATISVKTPFQLGIVADGRKLPPEAVDFVEQARFTRDDYGNWRTAYAYDATGPRWRLEGAASLRP